MKRTNRYVIIAMAVLCCLVTVGKEKECEASGKTLIINKVKEKTSEKIREVFYTDYDCDGLKEAFIITGKSDEEKTIWFSGEKEVKKLTDLSVSVWTGKGNGICKVSKNQKLFLAEGSAGGSYSWSYCFYVKNGRAVSVKKTSEGLTHIKGKNFAIYPGAFDLMVDSAGTSVGHTWKAYYLKWNGKKFIEYTGKRITLAQLKKYAGASSILKKINKMGYKIGEIYYRKNGVINVNLIMEGEESWIRYENITFNVKGSKVSLKVNYKKGKNIVEKSSYGGRYSAKGFC